MPDSNRLQMPLANSSIWVLPVCRRSWRSPRWLVSFAAWRSRAAGPDAAAAGVERASVYGDNAYGTGGFHDRLERSGIESKCKTQRPVAAGGMFAKGPVRERP